SCDTEDWRNDIKIADMSDEMQRKVLQCALLAVNMYEDGLDIATYIKKTVFEAQSGRSGPSPSWQCVTTRHSRIIENG
uniref:Dynein light chain n=1 Tax=Sinocyclocheilus anshuiensis TaxID=1608454 RepID=A0A671REF8_9TELE